MPDNDFKRNTSGYYDPTAYLAAEIKAANDAFESFFEHTIRPIIAEQIEQKRKAEENNETGEDGQGR